MRAFASLNSAPDAVRRGKAVLDLLAFWTIPLAVLGGWLLAGGFTLSALDSAAGAWRLRPATMARVADRIRTAPPELTVPAVPATRPSRVARPVRPDQSRPM
jgi:hypothetical protein